MTFDRRLTRRTYIKLNERSYISLGENDFNGYTLRLEYRLPVHTCICIRVKVKILHTTSTCRST